MPFPTARSSLLRFRWWPPLLVLWACLAVPAAWPPRLSAAPPAPPPAGGVSPTTAQEEPMSYIMVDIESDGPIPGDYSMISLGAVLVDGNLDKTFTARFRPISDRWVPDALAVSGCTREQTLAFPDPRGEMERFAAWIRSVCPGKPVFFSDNNGYDWQFVNWYFHHFLDSNPFGYSSQNLGSLYKGMVKDMRQNFKHLRQTTHTHDPLDDARGNAEALLYMIREMGLVVPGWPSGTRTGTGTGRPPAPQPGP